ncbi:hypothetical protein CMUS01_16638, partial [Colletotrichum musicola]
NSPVDYSRSPPRSIHGGSSASSIPIPRSTSRSSSVTSSRSQRTGASGSLQTGGPAVPSFLMMTPPTPLDSRAPHQGLGIELLRPSSRSSQLSPFDQSGGGTIRSLSRSAGTGVEHRPGERRKSAAGGFLRDKLSALAHRKREPSQSQKDSSPGQKEREDTPEREEDAEAAAAPESPKTTKLFTGLASRVKTG